MFKKIIVPLDGSARAESSVPIAVRIARSTGGSLLLLRVFGIPPQYTFYLYGSYVSQTPTQPQIILDEEQAKAQDYLEAIVQSQPLVGISTEIRLRSGVPAQAILDVAHEQHADLIVLCSHGRTGFTRWALGSVAQKVARHSSLPVLLLRSKESSQPMPLHEDVWHPPRILVALDGSPFAEAAIPPAAHLTAALAAPEHGALHLTQIVQVPPARHEYEDELRRAEFREQALHEATTYLSSLTDSLYRGVAAQLGLKVTWSTTAREDVADALLRMAEFGEETGSVEVQGCGFIAMATHGRGGFQRWTVGSITERVLDGTKLPLMIVRPQEQQPTASR